MTAMPLPFATLPALAAIPGLVHGFERRPATDRPETREESRARVARALASQGRLLLLRQVHGVTVAEAPWDAMPEADAACAASPGLLLGIQTADCFPLLVVDPRRGLVAAAHAGWRGTAAGIASRAVAALAARGSETKDLAAAIGPGIGPCCYEVGEDLRPAFGPAGASFFRPGPNGRPHLDLRAANARHFEEAGLRPEAVHHLDECTRCRADLYPSFRRDGAAAGRMISFVGFTQA